VNQLPNLGVQQPGIPFELYDSFATQRFGGNVAGVVVTKTPMAPSLMQDIASELGAPTTGFAHVSRGRPVSIRFFTTRQEIEACGHVTVAVATALVKRGTWPASCGQVQASTPVGPLSIFLRSAASLSRPQRPTLIGLAYHPRPLELGRVTREDVETALAVPADSGLPTEVIWTGLRHLIVPVDGKKALARIEPSAAALTSLATSCGADTICVFARLGDHGVGMRDFCAPIGALEEPASGTTSAALADYLARHMALSEAARVIIEQGAEMGRPSRIEVHVETMHDRRRATVWGSAIQTAIGTVFPT